VSKKIKGTDVALVVKKAISNNEKKDTRVNHRNHKTNFIKTGFLENWERRKKENFTRGEGGELFRHTGGEKQTFCVWILGGGTKRITESTTNAEQLGRSGHRRSCFGSPKSFETWGRKKEETKWNRASGFKSSLFENRPKSENKRQKRDG